MTLPLQDSPELGGDLDEAALRAAFQVNHHPDSEPSSVELARLAKSIRAYLAASPAVPSSVEALRILDRCEAETNTKFTEGLATITSAELETLRATLSRPSVAEGAVADSADTSDIAWQIADECWLNTFEKHKLAKRIRSALVSQPLPQAGAESELVEPDLDTIIDQHPDVSGSDEEAERLLAPLKPTPPHEVYGPHIPLARAIVHEYLNEFDKVRAETSLTDVWSAAEYLLRIRIASALAQLQQRIAEAERGHADARDNFLTMQGAANKLRIRAEAAEQVVVAAWNAFGGKVVDEYDEIPYVIDQADGDLAEQIRALTQQRDAAEAKLAEAVEALEPKSCPTCKGKKGFDDTTYDRTGEWVDCHTCDGTGEVFDAKKLRRARAALSGDRP